MNLHELRILHIDDEPNYLLGVEMLLKSEGARVFGMENIDKPEMALDIIKKHDVNFILLDVNLGGQHSFEFSKFIRKNILDQGLPIIFLTSILDRDVAQKAFDSGATDVLTKDFSGPEIYARIDSHHKAHISKLLKSNVANLTLVLDLTGQLLHEINNPLQILTGQIFKLREDSPDKKVIYDKMESNLDSVIKTLDQLAEIREKSLSLSKTKLKYQNYNSISNLLANYGLIEDSVQEIKDKNILFVDDELEILYGMKDLVKENWYGNIELATSAKEGLEVCREAKIDLVVTDLKMPDMDGIDFIKILNQEELVQKIIVMTGSWNQSVLGTLKELEITEILRKPIFSKDFLEILNKIEWD